MEVTGKLKSSRIVVSPTESKEIYNEATIELPPVDVSKIKEGDKVWVKTSVRTVKEGSDFIELNCCNDLIDIESIIVHFPQLQPKQEQNCNCENPSPEFKVDNKGIGFTNHCEYCRGKISQEKMEEYLKEKLPKKPNNPEVKVPEEITTNPMSPIDDSAWRGWVNITIEKLNEIIKYLEKKE